MPRKWMDFLRDSKNKEELFTFLTNAAVRSDYPGEKTLYITDKDNVISINVESLMAPCNHNADTRIGRLLPPSKY